MTTPIVFIVGARLVWRGSLLPFGCAAVVKSSASVLSATPDLPICDRFALGREQAPSPQNATLVFSELPLLSLKLTLT
ncbi:hypothetical protein EMIT0P100_50261 [Pseudomonas sp. IT-P100]